MRLVDALPTNTYPKGTHTMTRKTVINLITDAIGCACLFGTLYAALWVAPILDAIFSN